MPRRTLLILDDHTLFREGLAWLVREQFPGVQVLGSASTAELAEELPMLGPRDLLVVELSVQDAQPLRRLEACQARWPRSPKVALLERDAASLLAPLQAAGIDGVIVRTARAQAVQELLRNLWRSRRPAPAAGLSNARGPNAGLPIAGVLALSALPSPEQIAPPERWLPQTPPIFCASQALQDELAGFGLSPRQFDVLRLMVAGLTNKQISRALGLAESTVKTHVLSLFQKLGLGSRTEVVVWAGTQGLPGSGGAAWAPTALTPDLPAGRPCC